MTTDNPVEGTTSMTTEDTTNTAEDPGVLAGKLKYGQHILIHRNGRAVAHRVEHTLPYRNGDGCDMVGVTLSPIGGGEPLGRKWSAGYPLPLASEDQVAEAVDAAHRAAVVADLRKLADLLADCRVRLSPWPGPGVDLHLPEGEITRLAEALELELSNSGPELRSATWRSAGSNECGAGVVVTFQGKPAPEPEPAPVEVVELSGAEWDAACRAGLARLGLTYAQLAEQARTGRLRDPEAIKLWPTVKGRPELDLPADPQPDACPCVEQPEPEQEWLFTFGSGQVHDGRFVRITGTWASARSRMNLIFGHAWCDQYTWASFDAAGLPGRVTELPEAEWPAHADDPTGLGHDRAEVEDEPSGGPVPAGVDGLAVSGRSVPDGAR